MQKKNLQNSDRLKKCLNQSLVNPTQGRQQCRLYTVTLCVAAQLTSKWQRLPGNTGLTGRSHSHTNTQTRGFMQTFLLESEYFCAVLSFSKRRKKRPTEGAARQTKDNRVVWPLTPEGVWTNREHQLLSWRNMSTAWKWQTVNSSTKWQRPVYDNSNFSLGNRASTNHGVSSLNPNSPSLLVKIFLWKTPNPKLLWCYLS